ncbi:hypothetical protein [Flagellimonas crocea]|uniref:hypothetical protein n=1 Tax=Flagellimonas crocea TaxID=3067311 RepID=UPI00296E49FD|nr:hypothetical protein [Muricauda sp. DH64]
MAKDLSNKYTPGGYVKMMSILHIGILATPIILGILFYVEAKKTELSFSVSDDMFLAIVPIMSICCILLGDFLFKKITGSLPREMELLTKLTRFQTASIVKYALIEGAAIFCMVIFTNTQNLTYLLIGALIVLYLLFQRPTKQKIEDVLDLRGEEKARFDRVNKVLE